MLPRTSAPSPSLTSTQSGIQDRKFVQTFNPVIASDGTQNEFTPLTISEIIVSSTKELCEEHDGGLCNVSDVTTLTTTPTETNASENMQLILGRIDLLESNQNTQRFQFDATNNALSITATNTEFIAWQKTTVRKVVRETVFPQIKYWPTDKDTLKWILDFAYVALSISNEKDKLEREREIIEIMSTTLNLQRNNTIYKLKGKMEGKKMKLTDNGKITQQF